MPLSWSDSHAIAVALRNARPGTNPRRAAFSDLHRWICELPEFADASKKPSLRELSAIQREWAGLRRFDSGGLEKGLRFGCGALVGVLFGFYGAMRLWPSFDSGERMVATTIVVALLCGWAAMRRGERFFHQIPDWIQWLFFWL